MKKQFKTNPEREEKKARMRSFAARVAKMSQEEREAFAAQCPVVTIEGRVLSTHNQCMIAFQRVNATVVGGFRQWIKAGRAVMKGERGLCIWVRCQREAKDGQETSEGFFMLGSVFDISQTMEIATAGPEVNEAITKHAGELAMA